MNYKKSLNKIIKRRKARVRAKLFGTVEKPRLSIFKSNRYIYVQLIDDAVGKTVVSASTRSLPVKDKKNFAVSLGEIIAKKAGEKNINSVIFDRGHYKYHGEIKAIAESARKSGLKF
ncbi:50S ribosomal protein L18 [Candidatus Wolfebacteria bacterium]|nr:50S ribosomal protein L18 [Candidatus Wolfebacteria bacterium]